jgi:DNA-binding XRE family transcriptional regulator
MIKIDPRDKGPMKINVGRRLMEVRETFGHNQTEFAEKIGLPDKQSLVSMYERGARMLPPDIAVRIWEVFQITTDWMYRGDPGTLNPAIWQMLRDTRSRLEAEEAAKQIKAKKMRA